MLQDENSVMADKMRQSCRLKKDYHACAPGGGNVIKIHHFSLKNTGFYPFIF
jgi:hypothetical protein